MSENEEIKKAKEELDKISQDDKERRLAELREKALMDEIAIRDSGFKEGIEQGFKEGSQQEKISIAKNLLILKVDINSISQATGLSVEEIEKLK